jgi:hypothetical protein
MLGNVTCPVHNDCTEGWHFCNTWKWEHATNGGCCPAQVWSLVLLKHLQVQNHMLAPAGVMLLLFLANILLSYLLVNRMGFMVRLRGRECMLPQLVVLTDGSRACMKPQATSGSCLLDAGMRLGAETSGSLTFPHREHGMFRNSRMSWEHYPWAAAAEHRAQGGHNSGLSDMQWNHSCQGGLRYAACRAFAGPSALFASMFCVYRPTTCCC